MHLLSGFCAECAGGLSYYNFIRKPASDFGWDWGPAFAPAGIYGMVEIQAYSYAIMTGAFWLFPLCLFTAVSMSRMLLSYLPLSIPQSAGCFTLHNIIPPWFVVFCSSIPACHLVHAPGY